MMVSIIAARTERGVIGKDNALPWHLPADLKRFKTITTGHTIIMGRKTFESIGRPLPNRRSIVVSRARRFHAEGVDVVASLDRALDLAREEEEVFVIGGAELFREALPRADRLYLTVVHADVEGDTFFPAVTARHWTLLKSEHRAADGANSYDLSFEVYERTRSDNTL